jgi:hypothetical protein
MNLCVLKAFWINLCVLKVLLDEAMFSEELLHVYEVCVFCMFYKAVCIRPLTDWQFYIS